MIPKLKIQTPFCFLILLIKRLWPNRIKKLLKSLTQKSCYTKYFKNKTTGLKLQEMTNDNTSLRRFATAQEHSFENALTEIKNGRKTGHWMWYIFPQIYGLGFSETSKLYALKSQEETLRYLHDPVLGERLIHISKELLKLQTDDAYQIFGSPDDLKLRSSMTLFAVLPGADPVFQAVLDKFFNGEKDQRTLELLKHE